MKTGAKRWLQSTAGILLGLGFAYYLLRQVSLPEVGQHLSAFSLQSVLASTLLVILSVPLRAYQWHQLLGGDIRIPWTKVFRAVCLGNAGNLVLPMRGGELVKVASLKRSTALSIEKILLTLVLCRVQDLPFIGIIFLFFVSQVSLAELESALGISQGSLMAWPQGIHSHSTLIIVLVLGIFMVAIGGAMGRKRGIDWGFSGGVVAAWLKKRISNVASAIRSTGDPRRLITSTMAAGFCWLLFTSASIPLLLDLNIDLQKAVYAALMITGATTFIQLLPSAPTSAGSFHFGCTLGLSLALPEIGSSQAFAFAVALHGVGALAPTVPCVFLILAPRGTDAVFDFEKDGSK